MQEHKIYYKFAFDRTYQYEIKFPMSHSVKLNFLRKYIIVAHGFAASARCLLDICEEGFE